MDRNEESPGTMGNRMGAWTCISFAEKLKEPKPRPPLYTGEGEDNDFEETYIPLLGKIGVGIT